MTRVVLITGASRGIGAATARLAAERGDHVAVNYTRNTDAAQAVVAECVALGARAIEVARTILWLASDEASYITGTIVNCAGGR
jgi:NAD(P)-dependent dehydrogenase (short-subunit alcohol dehydrogenase family)